VTASAGTSTPPARRGLSDGQGFTLVLGLLVGLFLLTVSLPVLFRAPEASTAERPPAAGAAPSAGADGGGGGAAGGANAGGPARPSGAAQRVVRSDVPDAVSALSVVLLVLVAGTLVWGWVGSLRVVRSR
jgi:hypothetical protein